MSKRIKDKELTGETSKEKKEFSFVCNFPSSLNKRLVSSVVKNGVKLTARKVLSKESRTFRSSLITDLIKQVPEYGKIAKTKGLYLFEKDDQGNSQSLYIFMDLFLPDNRRRDVDNYGKVLLDTLTGVITEDDSDFVIYSVRKTKPADYRTDFPVDKGFALVRVFNYHPDYEEVFQLDKEKIKELLIKTKKLK